jgi:uncharacterized protein
VVEAVITGQVTAVVTPHLLDELAAVLARPKFRRWVTTLDALAFVEALGNRAELQPDATTPSEASRDPGDDYLMEAARTAAAVLVTGDKDLLDLDLEPQAATPREFLTSLTRGTEI